MLADVVPFLTCPVCDSAVALDGQRVRCAGGHTYDVARQGYVTLRRQGGFGGDSAPMVMAREAFLAAGHFAGLGELLAAHAARAAATWPRAPAGAGDGDRDRGGDGAGLGAGGCVVDVGAGTGYHLGLVLDRLAGSVGLALDASPYALRRAARAHPRAGAVGCDAWHRLPVRSGVASLLLNVLAPRNGAEFRRIAHPGATLLVVTPTRRHLCELVPALGLLTVDPHKRERLERTLHAHFSLVSHSEHEYPLRLLREEATALVQMGPNAWHTDPSTLARRVARLAEPVAVTASFALTTYRVPR